ncbi:hypothetical protein HPP92_020396 [Vanilla planifolia]|uniref:Uncharacterized protein n=1 Tax=Vanilla planifolia TaxID=51239 RepID=A0A835UIE4_VANPL|nr:hypothetical protein HPP92_020784 [Vanilla planifolia]KAG0461920.1 hypothetical protein HPP92_020396 [Vanilla planifolia]
MTISFIVRSSLLALNGITANQNFYLLELGNTSWPTFASAATELRSPITFLMAAALRNIGVRRRATVITLYKGPTIFSPSARPVTTGTGWPSWRRMGTGRVDPGLRVPDGNTASWSGWLVLQAPVLKSTRRGSPSPLHLLLRGRDFLLIAVFVRHDTKAWVFTSGSELFTILYIYNKHTEINIFI